MRLHVMVMVTAAALVACRDASPAAQPDRAPGAPAAAHESAAKVPVGTSGRADAAPAPAETIAREVTIPAGTRLSIVLDTTVGSDISRREDPVSAHVSRAVIVNGVTVLPQGSRVSGVVASAVRSGKVKGRAHVAVRFDSLAPRASGERYRIDVAPVGRTAPATKKKDALEIGVPAAGGALIGGLIGGRKGALIGTAAGGGAGTAVVLSTRGREVHLPKGAMLTVRLLHPITVRVG